MNDCTEYLDLISMYCDGELPEGDKARLDAHLSGCPQCAALLESFREISAAVEDSYAPVPDKLLSGVMERISELDSYKAPVVSVAADAGQSSAAKPRVTRRGTMTLRNVLTRYVPVAACLAIILLAAPRLSDLGCGSQLVKLSPDMAISGSSQNTAVTPRDGFAESAGAGYGGSSQSPAAPPPAALPEGEAAENSTAPEPFVFAVPSSMPEDIPEQSVGADARITDTADDEPGYLIPVELHKNGVYYAVISVSGELPEILESYAREEIGGGACNFYIPLETALELIDEGFPSDVLDKDAQDAIVVYSP